MLHWSKIYHAIRAALRRFLFFWVDVKILNSGDIQRWCKTNTNHCYIFRTRSFADSLVLEHVCAELNLLGPMTPLDVPGTFEHKRMACLKKTNHNPFKRKPPRTSNRIKRLFNSVRMHPELDIALIPVTVFWGRSPEKEKSIWKILFSDTWAVPSTLRKTFMILIHGKQTFIQFDEPISLRKFADQYDHQTDDESVQLGQLSERIHTEFKKQREALIGPDLSHRRTLVNTLLNTQRVQQAIADRASQKGKDRPWSERKARRYANEIASDYAYTMIRLYHLVLTWLWNKLYDGVEVYHAEALKSIARHYEIVYVPSHRSHIDYLLLSYVLYENALAPPHIAAGVNLNLPILGPILRRGGAFFMRRSFKGNKLYATIFDEYMHIVLSRGFSIEYFIEGGRSRTGRLLPPRAGMLSMTLKSFIRNSDRPIAFIPIYFGYERLFEGASYVGELKGKKKQKESLLSLIKTFGKIRRQFGKVHVSFAPPIYLKSFLDEQHPPWQSLDPNATEDYETIKQVSVKLARHINTQINAAACVRSINLVSTWLLATPKNALDRQSLREHYELARKMLEALRYSDEIVITHTEADDAIEYVKSMNMAQHRSHPLGNVLYCNEYQALLLTYFRNNCLHLFALPALIALLIANNSGIERQGLNQYVRAIYPFIKAELFLKWDASELDGLIDNVLQFMQSNALLITERQDQSNEDPLCQITYKTPDPGSRYYLQLKRWAALIQPTLERYYLVLAVLNRYGSNELTQSGLEELVRLMTERLSLLHQFNASEHYDKKLFHSFLTTLLELEIVQEHTEHKKLIHGQTLIELMNKAKYLVSADLRYTLMQIADGDIKQERDVVRVSNTLG